MRLLSVLVVLMMILALAGCGGARATPVSRSQAMLDTTPCEMRIIGVYDQLDDNMDVDHDENVSHMIQVRVLSGDKDGQLLLLPFDEWNVGKRPPAVGERVVVAPADWVKRDPDSKGRPYNGWPVAK